MAAKIVLRQTTKMTLSDRFGSLRSANNSYAGSSGGFGAHVVQQHTSSIRSRKLAQQMEKRPSVIAALKLKRKSLQNRLGSVGNARSSRNSDRAGSVRSRLTLSNRTQQGSLRGSNRRNTQRGRGSQKGNLRKVQQGGVNPRKGISPLLKGRLGSGGNVSNKRGGRRGGQRMALSRASFAQVVQAKKRNQKNRGGANSRNQSNRRRWGRGRGRGRGGQSGPVSKQDLDNDIDAYMAKTKSNMDNDLDNFMAID